MHDSEDIGARLREERKRCGLTQDQAAEGLGVAKRTLANYEAGSSDAPAGYLLRAAVQFGFDPTYIVTGTRFPVDMDSLSAEEHKVLTQYRMIPTEDQKAIRRFLQAMADDAE